MADNILINPGSGGDNVAADDIGGIKHQRVKIQYGDDGTAVDVSESNKLPVEVSFHHHLSDGFSRLRTSSVWTQFDYKQIHTAIHNSLIWTEKTTGGGSTNFLTNKATTRLSVGTASGDKITRQTKQYFNYQSGKSMLIFMTGVMGATKANVTRRIGYFDDDNGLFFENNGTDLRVVVRTNTSGTPAENAVAQSSWNIDKLDGTGSSGITLDMSKGQIFAIDFQWLAVGRVRFGFDIDGELIYCHEVTHANSITEVYMSTPNLPIRFELLNTGTTASSSQVDQICFSVMNEGGWQPVGITRSTGRGNTGIIIAGDLKPVLSLRLSSNHIRHSVCKFKANIISTTNSNFRWELVFNPTITGGATVSWSDVSTADSVMQIDIARNGVVSDGVVIAGGYGSNNSDSIEANVDSILTLAADVNGVADELVLAVHAIGTTDTFYGSMSWHEMS